MTVTREQGLAFVEALTGYVVVADQQVAAKSPHVMTHLEAVLGYDRVPSIYQMHYPASYESNIHPFWDYLRAVIDVLDTRENNHTESLERERTILRDLLQEFAYAGVSFEDDRLTYVELQVEKETLEEAKAILRGDNNET